MVPQPPFDVLIVGGGPGGLSAALVCARQQRTVLLADHGEYRNAAAGEAHMLLGQDGVPPARLRAAARDDLAHHDNVELRRAAVIDIRPAGDAFEAGFAGSRPVTVRRVILATGQEDVLPDVPGLAELFGHGLFHCPYCHGYEARGQAIGVLGAGYAHCAQAAYLADRLSDDVVLCTNGDPVDPPDRAELDRRGIAVHPAPLTGVKGAPGDLRLTFADGTELRRDALFHRTATRQRSDLAERLGCRFLPDGRVAVDAVGQTSVPGVYAVGDMARSESLPEATAFVTTAAADGLRAAVWVDQELLGMDADKAGASPSA